MTDKTFTAVSYRKLRQLFTGLIPTMRNKMMAGFFSFSGYYITLGPIHTGRSCSVKYKLNLSIH